MKQLILNQLVSADLMFLPDPKGGKGFAPNLNINGEDVLVTEYDTAMPAAQEVVNTWLQGKDWHGNKPASVTVQVTLK